MRQHPIDAIGNLIVNTIVFALGVGGLIGVVFAACVLTLRFLELFFGPL